jgi:transcription elongation factor Elf1
MKYDQEQTEKITVQCKYCGGEFEIEINLGITKGDAEVEII